MSKTLGRVLIALCASAIPALPACKSDPEGEVASVEEDPGPRSILQFAEVAEVDEQKGVTEHVFADDTIRLRKPRSFRIQDARAAHDQAGYPAVVFVIADSDKDEFRRWTGSLVHRKLALLVDGRVVAVPKVNAALPGAGIVEDETRHWTVEEATSLAQRLREEAEALRHEHSELK